MWPSVMSAYITWTCKSDFLAIFHIHFLDWFKPNSKMSINSLISILERVNELHVFNSFWSWMIFDIDYSPIQLFFTHAPLFTHLLLFIATFHNNRSKLTYAAIRCVLRKGADNYHWTLNDWFDSLNARARIIIPRNEHYTMCLE